MAEAEDTPARDPQARTARACGLPARNGLNRACLAAADPQAGPLADLVIDLDNPRALVQAYLLVHLADARRCEALGTTRPGPDARLQLSGHAGDIERTEILHVGLVAQLACALAAREIPGHGHQRAGLAQVVDARPGHRRR